MSKIRIKVYTNMNSIENMQYINAIRDNELVKYIDSSQKFVIDCSKKILIKENNESSIRILFNDNVSYIYVKDIGKEYQKNLEIIELIEDNRIFYVKYRLIDDDIVNEYKIEFL